MGDTGAEGSGQSQKAFDSLPGKTPAIKEVIRGTASGNRLFQAKEVGQVDSTIKETRLREMPKEPSKEEREHKGPNREPDD